MKLEKQFPPKQFVPITITLETEYDVICLRAVVDAARKGMTMEDVMRRHWSRKPESGPPQPFEAEDFARELHDFILGDN